MPNNSATAQRGRWVHRRPSRAADAPIVAPVTAQTPTPYGVAVDAASDITLKGRRINPVVDQRLHRTLYVMVMVVAYMTRDIVFLSVAPIGPVAVF